MEPLVQKHRSAYYAYSKDGATEYHYVMFGGVRTRHSSADEALAICEGINQENDLPHVNAVRSSTFNQRKTYVS